MLLFLLPRGPAAIAQELPAERAPVTIPLVAAWAPRVFIPERGPLERARLKTAAGAYLRTADGANLLVRAP